LPTRSRASSSCSPSFSPRDRRHPRGSWRDEVWDLESTYIARGMEIYIACYSPQMIILGGGVMKQTQLFAQVRQKTLEYLNGYLVSPELADIDGYIVEASCKGDQGVLGLRRARSSGTHGLARTIRIDGAAAGVPNRRTFSPAIIR